MFSFVRRIEGTTLKWLAVAVALQLVLAAPLTDAFAASASRHKPAKRAQPVESSIGQGAQSPAEPQAQEATQEGAGVEEAADPQAAAVPQATPAVEAVKPMEPVPAPQPVFPAQRQQERGTIVLNFSDASLRDILRTVGDITGENFIIAPGVTAKISVQTAKPIAKKDVFGIFESLLEINGLAAVREGQYFKIVPASAAKQHSLSVFSKNDKVPSNEMVMNMVVPVEFVSANDVISLLKPTLSPSGNISSYTKGNTLIITDTAQNIKGYLEMISVIDVDAFKKMKIELVQADSVDVKTLHRELSEVFTVLGYGKDSSALMVVPIERLNSLILFSQSDALLESAKDWIKRLDQKSSAEAASVHIYYVQNDKASTISAMLDQIYGGKKPAVSTAKATATATAAGAPQASAQVSARTDGNEAINIFVYEPSNALIIQSSQRDYQNILATLKELDRPPKQVLIDAVIAEVKLDDSLKYGIQWSLLSGKVNVQQNTGIVPSTIQDPTGAITPPFGLAAPAGLSAVATDASRFFAALQALSTTGNVNVLSNPHVLVKNYEKASINVGSDEPVATQSAQTAVTGTAGVIQNIEYRKTGIILTVTPQITEGGMVSMTIRQEVSDKSTDRTVGNAVYPSFTKREAETSVVAKDGEALVIGGLIQDRVDRTASGIPLLSKIPLLGALFRFTNNTHGKTELVILLTPRVISNNAQAATVSSEMKGRLEGLKELLKKSNQGK